MRYSSARAFRAALEQRLRADATRGEGPADAALLGRLRKRVTFERFLARLHAVAPGEWALKGGFALELRLANLARATKDIDVDWGAGDREIVDVLLDAVSAGLGDHFAFQVERIALPADVEGQAQRWRLVARLDRRQFEIVLLDIGLNRRPVLEPVELSLSPILGFADVPTVRIPVHPIEQHVAEKLHAYTRRYGPEADKHSSRVKDLIDLALIASNLPVDGASLRLALEATFDQRSTHPLPARLPSPPRSWEAAWAKQAGDPIAKRDLSAGHAIAAQMLDPALADTSHSGTWAPEHLSWSHRAGR